MTTHRTLAFQCCSSRSRSPLRPGSPRATPMPRGHRRLPRRPRLRERRPLSVTAKLVEIPSKLPPDDLYDYAYVMRYEVVGGPMDSQSILVAHYKPRAAALAIKDQMKKVRLGKVRSFHQGDVHKLKLATDLKPSGRARWSTSSPRPIARASATSPQLRRSRLNWTEATAGAVTSRDGASWNRVKPVGRVGTPEDIAIPSRSCAAATSPVRR